MLLQVGGAIPRSSLELLQQSSGETQVVLAITALFSIVSWFIIGLKWWQFHGSGGRPTASSASSSGRPDCRRPSLF